MKSGKHQANAKQLGLIFGGKNVLWEDPSD
jgi:hypothetical protein